ncbi:MAG: BamA/TamA family outer membrane protein [Ignavibacteriae bacterium]|nr:BamA/TamA family outer membrane protein [Ignavibacteriota bacterium]
MRFFYCFFLLWFAHSELRALESLFLRPDSNQTQTAPIPVNMASSSLPQEGELNDILFEGNAYFSSSILSDAISLRPTDLSYAHKIFGFYYRQLSINPYTPPPLRDGLATALRNYQDEYRFFDETSAENDVSTLENLYNQNGFHNVTVSYTFTFDTNKRINVLTFRITENKAYIVNTIAYTGLGVLPDDLKKELDPLLHNDIGSQFNEGAIKLNADKITLFLQNKGYYYAHYLQPEVASFPTTSTDSITIPFEIGKRCKIGVISLKHDYRDQPAVSSDLVRVMLDFKEGDWYNRSAVSHSQVNLYNLGTFDLVVIDTQSIKQGNDYNTLNMNVFLQYRKVQEIGLAPFINHTTYDNFTNFGVEASYLHHNFGGSAQSFTPFIRVVWQDFGISGSPLKFTSISREFIGGVQFSQPLLFSMWTWRVGGAAQGSYSNRRIQSGLPFQTIPLEVSSLPVRLTFPITLPTYTLFNSLILDFSTEWQNIVNIAEVSGDLFEHGIDISDDPDTAANTRNIIAISEFITPYYQIDNYTQNSFKNLGFIASLTAIGDTRNNPFTPLTGNYLTISIEGANSLGFMGTLYRFSRFQITESNYWNIVSNDVFAFKIRAGYINITISDTTFIPFEKRFFAGGANSVRSYPSRGLFDRKSSNLDSALAYTNNLTGNGAILEGSFEYRYRFARPSGMNSTLADQIEALGVTIFMDWGNVFNRIKEGYYNTATIGDIINGLAVGIGAGIRRETPVGPVRVDFAVRLYDPTSQDRQWIFSRAPFKDLQVHIGLGHAF